MKVRKITKSGHNGRLLNVAGFLPSDWEYTEVRLVKKGKDHVVIQIIEIKIPEGIEPVAVKISR